MSYMLDGETMTLDQIEQNWLTIIETTQLWCPCRSRGQPRSVVALNRCNKMRSHGSH